MGPATLIHSIVSNNQELKESFYVLDLARVASLIDRWTRILPTIHPFYAVKYNPNPTFLSAMAALGASFDYA
ncbi:ornithine decarboxylase, partial [Sarracenia purpurea var. burkii]